MNLRASALVLLGTLTVSTSGCYNTYELPQEEFRKLQSAAALGDDRKLEKITPEEMTALQERAEADSVAVQSVKNEKVAVNRDTKLFVRSQGGRRFQLTPFNFSMASSQLVASDRDTLMPVSELKSFEVDQFSNGKTIAMVSLGAAAAAGLIIAIIQTAGKKTFQ